MAKRTSRRQFLKTGLASALSLAVAPLLEAAPRPAAARVPVNERVLQAVTQPSFTALPSTLPLGQPLADISMGWDGSVWGIDTDGVPHQYDTVAQSWQIYGAGPDAVAIGPQDAPIFVQGDTVSIGLNPPIPISSAWQNLPPSFALGLDGAATANSTLYLFRHGRYLAIDPATNVPTGSPTALTALANWPTTSIWQQGVVDAVGSNPDDPTDPQITLWAGGEVLTVDLVQGSVIGGPVAISTLVSAELLAVMNGGFSAVFYDPDPISGGLNVFQGMLVWVYSNADQSTYAKYAATVGSPWAPRLAHAPSGQTGALWAAANNAGAAWFHNGTTWQPGPAVPGGAAWLAAGTDGTVFALSASDTISQLSSNGTTWNGLAAAPGNAVQVSAGDADHVWLRDSASTVWRLTGGTFSQVALGASATDIAANADGTLWHAAGNANAYRFISEATAASTPLTLGSGVSAVTSVASTGFGSAYVLATSGTADPQLYGYDAPYAWKTSASYWTLPTLAQASKVVAVGGTSVFLFTILPSTGATAQAAVVALDAQSGAALWQPFALPAWTTWYGGTLVYDAALDLVYVAGGTVLYALDAASGTKVWSLDVGGKLGTTYGLLGPLTLGTGVLAVGRNDGAVVLLDTAAALASAQQNQPVQLLWTSVSLLNPSQNPLPMNMGAPAFDPGGTVYVQAQYQSAAGMTTSYQPLVLAFDPSSGETLWSIQLPQANKLVFDGGQPADLVVGTTTASDGTAGVPALFVNAGAAVYALDPTNNGSTMLTYPLPDPTTMELTAALAYTNDQLYCGDNLGTLRVLDATTLTLSAQTTDSVPPGLSIVGQPALVSDGDGSSGVAVLFTRGDANVYVFDPDTGILEHIATDLSNSSQLAYDALHGLLYTIGADQSSSVGQVFALRPDSAIQAERAFIIESQLMQDYGSDAEAQGDGVARYQTHVSVVDATNAAQPNVALKLWADDDDTAVTIDGNTFTIGPQTPALWTTDGTGTCTIISDATDLTTTSLRVWAAFMDASECITITPDAEFHQRLAAATATGATDPRQLDMVSAASYDGTPLFPSDAQNSASQAAQAVTGTLSSVGVGTASGSVGRQPGGTSPKYTVYPALPGMAYSAVTVAANEALAVQSPLGLSLTSSGYSPLTPAAAADAIDALTGTPPQLLGSLFSDLKHAWDDIKQAAATVTQVVVSVAKQVYVGIQYVANNVTNVVKAIAQDVGDAMATIGSFFVQLGKDLEHTIEALGVFLHLDEIIKTATIIQGQMDSALANLSTTLTNGKATCDSFFSTVESSINTGFCNLFALMDLPPGPGCPPSTTPGVGSGTPLSGINGMGATPTTVYNTGQSGPSQAVPCGWSNHVLRMNMYQVSTPSSVSDSPAFDSLMSEFFDSLASNTQLAQAYSDVGSTFRATFKANSAKDFFELALEDVLEIIKALLITGVSLVQALVDTLLSPTNLATVVSEIQNLGTISIPVLSTLWTKVTGDDMSFFDLFTLVLAFPVTFMYRAFVGYYPGDSSGVQQPRPRRTLLGGILPTEPTMLKNVMGLVAAGAMLTKGWISMFLDAAYVIGGGDGTNGNADYGLGYLGKVKTVIGLLQSAGSLGWGQVDAPPSTTIHEVVVYTVTFARICLGAVGNSKLGNEPITASYLGAELSAFSAIEAGTHYDDTNPVNKLVLARSVLGQVAGFVNPVKTWGTADDLYPFIPAAADAAFGDATAGLMAAQVLETMQSTDGDKGVYRRYLPRIHRGG